MKANRFEPRDLTIGARQKVTWTNNDSLGHTVTADDGSFDSHPKCGQVGGSCMNRGQSFSHTFANPGRYQYYCRNHGSRSGQGMSGTIEVK